MENQTEQIERLINIAADSANERLPDRVKRLLADNAISAAQIEAADIVYERLQTAAAICRSVFGVTPDAHMVFDVFKELIEEEVAIAEAEGSES